MTTEAPKSTAKRDKLRAIEQEMQAEWEAAHVYEANMPSDWQPGQPRSKYLVTFPYPYMNGCLHIGHAFTVTKAEFAARYEKLQGKNALFPFGFHCTGMPIKACADKLRGEIAKYGNPPKFPSAEEMEKEAAAQEEKKKAAEEQKKAAEAKAAGQKEAKAAGEFHGRKAKVAQKKAAPWQWEILRSNGVPEDQIAEFVNTDKWLDTFPAQGKKDLEYMGVAVDWRRSFITTDKNPFYDSFVRWQFENLRLQERIAFGKRYTIYSPKDGQACADHERKEGEGVLPQEYTLIKMEVVAGHEGVPKKLHELIDAKEGRRVFLVAGTLRPETMIGQTNCWALPECEYGAFAAPNNEVFVCTTRAARNMAFQGLSEKEGEVTTLCTITGEELMGCPLRAPTAKYDVVRVLPMLSIDPEKGTGIVTCVPSDSPDDWINFTTLKNKPEYRKKLGVADEWIMPYEIVPIIDIPEYGDMAAEKACAQFKVNGPNDKVHLAQAKEATYTKGFYQGTMILGPHSGMKVKDAKPLVREDLLKANQAAVYCEPASRVVSRSEDECVVALCDQWYLKYGEEKWRAATEAHVKEMNFYNNASAEVIKFALGWMNQWACSRNFGLGTRLPWDPKYLIESLSDSTVYMAYYTIAHLLQGNTLDGSKPNELGITADQMTTDVWNYIFMGTEMPDPAKCGIAKEKMERLRREFLYWYPLDLRVSGKDLLQNHLLFCLYNHAALFPDLQPVAFRANGHLLLNNQKMSKSTGVFYTLRQGVDKFSADGMRVALADAGDSVDDANFVSASADAALLRMHTLLQWIEEVLGTAAQTAATEGSVPITSDDADRALFHDRVFENQINAAIEAANASYSNAMYRDALVHAMFDMQAARDSYRTACELMKVPMKRSLVVRFAEVQALILSPIAPHFSDYIWRKVLHHDGFIWRDGHWPQLSCPVDHQLLDENEYIENMLNGFRVQIQKYCAGGKPKKGQPATKNPPPTAGEITIARSFPEWIVQTYDVVRRLVEQSEKETGTATFPQMKALIPELNKVEGMKPNVKKAMSKAAAIQEAFNKHGKAALNTQLTFSEEKLLNELKDYITKALGLNELTIKISETPDEKVIPGAPGFIATK